MRLIDFTQEDAAKALKDPFVRASVKGTIRRMVMDYLAKQGVRSPEPEDEVVDAVIDKPLTLRERMALAQRAREAEELADEMDHLVRRNEAKRKLLHPEKGE